ncbi:hypothetical protein BSL78_22792 [Apostichopus japonicus]|uniref:CobW/HypB/UreG nucleotide-binding domain-containing protein n=1 Tax=Stichopus japonicus TaxID=307972 RepID=A0A2G8JXF2_STIJA|nr:hypothetical protein BSL78_22792 [Apostichopus japonicus]
MLNWSHHSVMFNSGGARGIGQRERKWSVGRFRHYLNGAPPQRAFTVGIVGPVGSGKAALVLSLCKHLREKIGVCVVTNDIFTREDWEFFVRNKALPEERMRAVETGGCPHEAIREDYSINMETIRDLTKEFKPEIILVESGGDEERCRFDEAEWSNHLCSSKAYGWSTRDSRPHTNILQVKTMTIVISGHIVKGEDKQKQYSF